MAPKVPTSQQRSQRSLREYSVIFATHSSASVLLGRVSTAPGTSLDHPLLFAVAVRRTLHEASRMVDDVDPSPEVAAANAVTGAEVGDDMEGPRRTLGPCSTETSLLPAPTAPEPPGRARPPCWPVETPVNLPEPREQRRRARTPRPLHMTATAADGPLCGDAQLTRRGLRTRRRSAVSIRGPSTASRR